ncbi:MAG: FkbM family methyltransferase [Acidimicrobiales bacterium]
MLTIFSTAKPFRGHPAIIQRNAITSWLQLVPTPEIILFGDDDGVAELCDELGLRHVADVKTSESGAPLVSDMFERARELASNPTLCFVNADIIVPQRALDAVSRVVASQECFLLVGRRIDLDVDEPIDFGRPDWADELVRRAETSGRLRGDLCIDWFVFPKGLYPQLPEFAIGRTRYDNWLIWKAGDLGATVVDASPYVKVIHQNHDYGHLKGSLNAWEGAEAQRSEGLLGHWTHYHSIAHATLVVSASGDVVPATGWRYGLARPRRQVAQRLRFTRPWRRRARLALKWARSRLRSSPARLAGSLAPSPSAGPVPSWRFGEPRPATARSLARLGIWRMSRRLGTESLVTVNWLAGTRLELELGNDLSRCIYVSGVFEPNETSFLASWLAPGMVVIDIGANEGVYTVLAAKLVGPAGRVVAVEPSPRERARLQRNIELNRLGDVVTVRPEGLLAEAGTESLRLADRSHTGQNTFGQPIYAQVHVTEEIEVPVTTLDALCTELALDRVDLVKVDVEGAELAVLTGGVTTLAKLRPLVLLELQEASLRFQGASAAEVLALLAEHRYEICRFDPATGLAARPRAAGAPPALASGARAGDPEDLNVLAVPIEQVDSVLAGKPRGNRQGGP